MLRRGSARRPVTRAARRWIAVVAIVVVLGAGTAAWAATRGSGSPTTTSILATASRGTIRSTVSATGTLQPARQADLGFAVSGTVRTVTVAVGDRVRTGQVLATVGAAALRADRAAAGANLAAAQSQLVSDTAAGADDTQLTSDDAAVRSARSALTSARAAVRDASLRATFSGRVASVGITIGDSVSGSGGNGSGDTGQATGSSTTSAGTITVISTSAYIVAASVGSSDLASLKKGLQAQITPTGTTQTLYGTVSAVGLVAESSGSTSGSSSSGSATFPVTIAVTGDVTGVLAGSSADVSIIVKQVPDVLTVPTAAVHSSAGKTTVTVSRNGKQVVTPVTIGQVYGAQTEITAGLKAGQQVVVTTFRLPTGTGTGTGQNRFGGEFPRGGGFGPGGGTGGFGPGGGAGTVTGGSGP